MGTSAFAIDHFALDLVERWRGAKNPSSVFSDLTDAVRFFGFESVIVTGLPVPGANLEPLVLAHRWPDGWWERYNGQKYAAIDPTVKRLRTADADSFRWSDTRGAHLKPAEVRVLDEAGDFGLKDGYCIPIPLIHGFEAVVSLGGPHYMLTPREEAALHVIGICAYHAIRPRPPPGEQPKLSAREVECIKWTAAGKTAWEIGEILGLTEATVNAYLAAAGRKMGTRGRTYLVAQCLRRGIIQ